MLSLADFLRAAPKSYLIKLYRRDHPQEGLLKAQRVLELALDWACREARIRDILAGLDAEATQALAAIYLAGDRGVAEGEALENWGKRDSDHFLFTLRGLEYDLLIHSRRADSVAYYGFPELSAVVLTHCLGKCLPPEEPAAAGQWIGYRHFLKSHLAHVLARVASGEMKLTQGGELHRKDQQLLASRFGFAETLSASVAQEESQFLLRFATEAGLVAHEDGTLRLGDEGRLSARAGDAEIQSHLFSWWVGARLGGAREAWLLLAGTAPAAFGISALAGLLGFYSARPRPAGRAYTWDNLPRALQELWLLGAVDFCLHKGRIQWARLDAAHLRALASPPPPGPEGGEAETGDKAISLANLESLVPITAPFHRQFRLELIARRSNDEFITRYRFTKESVVQALQAGLPMDEFQATVRWLGFDRTALQTLTEWAGSYASTLFKEGLLLKVSNPGLLDELTRIPQFLALVEETIPGYGFALNRANKAKVRELLTHFGYVPGDEFRASPRLEPVRLQGTEEWRFAVPEGGEPHFPEQRPAPGLARLRAAAPPKPAEWGLGEKIQALEKAIDLGKNVELSYASPPKSVLAKPLMVLKHKDPVRLIGTELSTGHREEYPLGDVRSIRVME